MSDQSKSDKFALSPELASLQARLVQFSPTAPRVDRDQLMFDAGRAAERAGQDGRAIYIAGPSWADCTMRATGSASARFWPAATATMTAATILLATMLVWQNQSQPIARDRGIPHTIVEAEQTAAASKPSDSRTREPRLTAGYLGVRDVALTRGFGTLANEFNHSAPDATPTTEPATARQLLDELLPEAAQQRS